jgi:8-oxo-dGTP diphosphatase
MKPEANASGSRKVTEVAVGVVFDAAGRVLLADRPQGKPYSGYWEFPGGKIEAGEDVAAALARELHEELGIDIERPTPWVTFEFDYPHAYVRLHFQRVTAWRGRPRGREGQRLDFFSPVGVPPDPLLPAAVPALKWLGLPTVCAVTHVAALGRAAFVAALDRAMARGLRFVLLREPQLAEDDVAEVLDEILPRARAAGARLVVSSRHARELWSLADGVHLTARDLAGEAALPELPWRGASVHSRAELLQAARRGCDYAVLGPVLATPSHPGAAVLNWSGFASIAMQAPIPVLAIGGLCAEHLVSAQVAGAHGVAMLRGAWADPV